MKTATTLLLILLLPVLALAQVDSASPSPAPRPPSPNNDILNMDIEQLVKVPVRVGSQQTNLTAPSSQVSGVTADAGEATSTADLLKQAPSVSARRVSAITLDPRVRGYNSNQLNATANGVNQLKTRMDIDTLFSQIDPGIVNNITIIDGPYTSLYGPGFAFLIADLLPAPRFETPQTHLSTNFVYGSNAQALYTRDNAVGGGKDWGVCFSYGLRDGNDYRSGGPSSFLVPSRYQKWDGMLALGFDLGPISRFEFNCLRTEMNDVELPGVIYDLQNSKNDQYNFSYIIQEDPKGPKQVVLQAWYTQTLYHGDASRSSKQESFYRGYITESDLGWDIIVNNTKGVGDLESMGARLLRTFGEADSPQWTVGADWRRSSQRYLETNWTVDGAIAWDVLYGIPRSRMDDFGALTDVMLPLSDTLAINVGGRVDQTTTALDMSDPIVSQYDYQAYIPRFGEPANTLGMAYITAKKKLTEPTSLRAGIAFAMRNPELTELYNHECYVPIYRFGNSYIDGCSELRPEKNLQLDLGLTHESKKATYGVRAFHSIIRDYLVAAPCYISAVPPSYIDSPKALGRNFQYWLPYQRMDDPPNTNADYCQANFAYVNVPEATLLGGELFGDFQGA